MAAKSESWIHRFSGWLPRWPKRGDDEVKIGDISHTSAPARLCPEDGYFVDVMPRAHSTPKVEHNYARLITDRRTRHGRDFAAGDCRTQAFRAKPRDDFSSDEDDEYQNRLKDKIVEKNHREKEMRYEGRMRHRNKRELNSDDDREEIQFTRPNKVGHRIRDPKPFDGVKIEWCDYIKHFETVADWNGWTLAERAKQLVMCFDGEAIKLLGELPKEVLCDYKLLVQDLNRRYDPTERAQAWKVEFRNRFRKPTESIMQYAQSLTRLVSKAFPNMPSYAQQQWVLDQFTLGIGSLELQRHVQFGHPKALSEAVSLATEYEAFETGMKQRKPYHKPSEVFSITPVADHSSSNRTFGKDKPHNPSQGNRGYPGYQKNSTENTETRRCHYCKKSGHLIKDCWSLKQKQQMDLQNINQFQSYPVQWQSPQPSVDYKYSQHQHSTPVSAPFQAATCYVQNPGN